MIAQELKKRQCAQRPSKKTQSCTVASTVARKGHDIFFCFAKLKPSRDKMNSYRPIGGGGRREPWERGWSYRAIISQFTARYPQNLITLALSEIPFENRKESLQQKPSRRKTILPFVTQYQPSFPSLTNILMKPGY